MGRTGMGFATMYHNKTGGRGKKTCLLAAFTYLAYYLVFA